MIESGLAPTVSREGKHLFIIMVDAVKPYEEEFDTFAGNAELYGIQPYADFLHFHKKGDIL